jgi:transcriptional regulator with XRE-family HTH domain
LQAAVSSANLPHMEIGKRIKAARKRHKWTQEDLAANVGVTRGAVCNWELGSGMTNENLARVSEITGAPIEWLMKGEGPPGFDLATIAKHPAGRPSPENEPVDAEFLRGLLAKTFEAMGRHPAQAQFLASTLLDASRHPPPSDCVGQQVEVLQRSLARIFLKMDYPKA